MLKLLTNRYQLVTTLNHERQEGKRKYWWQIIQYKTGPHWGFRRIIYFNF
jgi:hypothetical protein